jgi:signal transduction histidine kinase/ligand-binding sensor domain-containing protein
MWFLKNCFVLRTCFGSRWLEEAPFSIGPTPRKARQSESRHLDSDRKEGRLNPIPGRWPIVLLWTLIAISRPELSAAADHLNDEYVVTRWETEDGLPENSATAMVQKSDGYLWFGTFKGLLRFDGVKFAVFDETSTPPLPNSSIVNLHLDKQDRLWVSTADGIARLETNFWHTYRKAEGWTGDFVRSFAEDNSGSLYVSSFDGKIFQWKDDRFAELPTPPGEPGRGYFAHVDEVGTLWAAQHRFFGRFDGSTWTGADPSALFSGESLVGAGPSRDGGLWVLFNQKLRKFKANRWIESAERPSERIDFWSLYEDSAQNVWIASYNFGWYRIGPDGVRQHFHTVNGLTHNQVRFAFEDRESNLWIGTSGGGLKRLKHRLFQNRRFGREDLAKSYRSVAEVAPGQMLIGTFGGGAVLVESTNTAALHFPGRNPESGYVTSVLKDRSGRIWVGTQQDGVFILDGEKKVRLPPAETEGQDIFALFEDSLGAIWIGTRRGLVRFRGWERTVFGPDDGFPKGSVVCMTEIGKTGRMWIGTGNQGLYEFDRERFRRIPLAGLPEAEPINCLLADPDGTLWIGTSNSGLVRWRAGASSRITTEHGLPACSIGCILDDQLGYLWLGSNRGVLRLERAEIEAVANRGVASLTCYRFDQSDGLASVECAVGSQPTGVRDSQGRLWFATLKGMAVTDPRALRLNTNPPPVVFEEVVTEARRSYPPRSSPVVRHSVRTGLELPPGTLRVEIRFAGLSYSAPEKMRFQYRLGGNEEHWNDLGNERRVEFHQLPPGRYELSVRAANNDGFWSRTGTALAFAIQPFYWQTVWFRSLLLSGLAGGAGGAVVFLWRKRSKRWLDEIEKQREIKEAQVKADAELRAMRESFTQQLIGAQEREKKRIATELHDSVGQNLVLIRSHALLVRETLVAREEASHIESILELSAAGVEEVRIIAQDMHPYQLDKLGLAEAIRSMLHRAAATSTTRFTVRIEEINGVFTKEADANIYRLVQEATNNILKHSCAPEASVVIRRDIHCVRIVISDNGRGLKESPLQNIQFTASTGLGFMNMRERVNILGGTFEIAPVEGGGMKLTFEIPLPK